MQNLSINNPLSNSLAASNSTIQLFNQLPTPQNLFQNLPQPTQILNKSLPQLNQNPIINNNGPLLGPPQTAPAQISPSPVQFNQLRNNQIQRSQFSPNPLVQSSQGPPLLQKPFPTLTQFQQPRPPVSNNQINGGLTNI